MATTLATTRANNDVMLLIGRLLLGSLFVLFGTLSLIDPTRSIEMLETLRLPAPLALAYAAAAFQLLAGAMIIIGFKARIAAILLALFCVLTAILFHSKFANPVQFSDFFRNLAIAGGFLLLCAVGPGRLSVDGKDG